MSLTSFLEKIWDSVKSIFDNLDVNLKTAVNVGVQVVENVKDFVDSPEADILTALIPGELDDDVKNLLRTELPKLLTELKLVDDTLGLTDPAAITAAAVKVLQGLDGDVKSAFLHNLSILVAQVAADGKLSWSDGVFLLEWYYKNNPATAPTTTATTATTTTPPAAAATGN